HRWRARRSATPPLRNSRHPIWPLLQFLTRSLLQRNRPHFLGETTCPRFMSSRIAVSCQCQSSSVNCVNSTSFNSCKCSLVRSFSSCRRTSRPNPIDTVNLLSLSHRHMFPLFFDGVRPRCESKKRVHKKRRD